MPVVGVDEDGHQAAGLGEAVDVVRHLGHRVLVLGVARHAAQVPELQLHRRHLRGGAVGAPLGRVPSPGLQVHVGEGDARRCVE